MSNISNLEDYRTPTPNTKNSKVTNTRKYKDVREREYLTSSEIERISKAAKSVGRHGHRDCTIIMIAYHHALRVSELVNLKWSQVDLTQGLIHVNRLKNGVASVHPLSGQNIRALRKLKRDYPDTQYIFITERLSPITTSTVRKTVKRAGEKAGLPFPIHPHMFRHSTKNQEVKVVDLRLSIKPILVTIRCSLRLFSITSNLHHQTARIKRSHFQL